MPIRMGSIPAAALALAACAAMPADRPDGQRVWGPLDVPGEAAGLCDAAAGQGFVGERASPALGRRLLAATRAAELRWAPPRSALTMDYNPARLTVEYDDDMVITRIACG